MKTSQFSEYLKWQSYFEGIGLNPEIIEMYLPYIEGLVSKDLPVVFELKHLSMLLGRNDSFMAAAINSSESFYRIFYIPKKKGGKREITSPMPSLLECQKWILDKILYKIPVSRHAHGFVHDRSIITNAKRHLKKPCLLKMDLKDFFPSIKLNRVVAIFMECGYAPNISLYLSKLCCYKNYLSQGSATSPAISNIVTRKLDARLSALSKKFQLTYTRYADDLTFSGKNISNSFVHIVSSIVQDEGFTVNVNKTRQYNDSQRKIVTGLNVSGNKLTIPRSYKRSLRQEIFHLVDKGFYSHIAKKKIHDPYYIDSIYGKLIFWKSIEPQNNFVNLYMPKLKEIKKSL